MSNLQDRSPNKREYSERALGSDYPTGRTAAHRAAPVVRERRGSSIKAFFSGMIVMALLGATAVGLYLLNHEEATVQPSASATIAPTAPEPQTTATSAASQSNSPAAPSDASLPPAQTLNLQQTHPNGSTLRLTQLVFADNSITVTLAVTNGYRSEIRLNANHDMVLLDNLGNQYNLVEPPENAAIRLDRGMVLKGDFVFSGRIAPNATSLTLVTNRTTGGSEPTSATPKITIANIPVRETAAP